MEFSREEYWSGLPFPSPGYLPDPGIKPGSPSAVWWTLEHQQIPTSLWHSKVCLYSSTAWDALDHPWPPSSLTLLSLHKSSLWIHSRALSLPNGSSCLQSLPLPHCQNGLSKAQIWSHHSALNPHHSPLPQNRISATCHRQVQKTSLSLTSTLPFNILWRTACIFPESLGVTSLGLCRSSSHCLSALPHFFHLGICHTSVKSQLQCLSPLKLSPFECFLPDFAKHLVLQSSTQTTILASLAGLCTSRTETGLYSILCISRPGTRSCLVEWVNE